MGGHPNPTILEYAKKLKRALTGDPSIAESDFLADDEESWQDAIESIGAPVKKWRPIVKRTAALLGKKFGSEF